MVLILSGGWW